jgi:uncharacterized Zn-finger protein
MIIKHSGELPHACDEPGCAYRAATADNLRRHERTHSVERQYRAHDLD